MPVGGKQAAVDGPGERVEGVERRRPLHFLDRLRQPAEKLEESRVHDVNLGVARSRATTRSAAATARSKPSWMSASFGGLSDTRKVACAKPAQAGAYPGSSAIAFWNAFWDRSQLATLLRWTSCLPMRYAV